jgi:tRNA (guanine-N7-)-methyltransferase
MRVRTHTNPLNFHERLKSLNLEAIFPTSSDALDFEVGFGRGIFLRHWAKTFPERNIIGVEVRKNIVSILNERIKKENIENTHLIHGSAEIALEDTLADHSLDNIFVFHPDPWFKKRHHKRRVVRPQFLKLAAKKLKPGGKLYVSTDVTPLWEGMMESISESPFKEVKDEKFWTDIYTTHWHTYREEENRDFNFGTFEI